MAKHQLKDKMKNLRDVLFPAIGLQVITGFNSYVAKEDSQDNRNEENITINYLHEDLLENKLHYMQIKRMLEKYCDQIKTQKIKHETITRFSSYRLELGWEAEQYFLIDQTSVEEEEVDDLIKQNITVIGCGPQNELIIECDKDVLEYILEQFRLYANKYEINQDTGEYVLISKTNRIKPNLRKTWDKSWEIPCIIVRAEGIDKIKTYEKVREISFKIDDEIASLIIGDKWGIGYDNDESATLSIPPFKEYLSLKNFMPDNINSNYSANKIFFDWINKVNWKMVAKTQELYPHMFNDII